MYGLGLRGSGVRKLGFEGIGESRRSDKRGSLTIEHAVKVMPIIRVAVIEFKLLCWGHPIIYYIYSLW